MKRELKCRDSEFGSFQHVEDEAAVQGSRLVGCQRRAGSCLHLARDRSLGEDHQSSVRRPAWGVRWWRRCRSCEKTGSAFYVRHPVPRTVYRTALYHLTKCDGLIPIQYRNRNIHIKRIVRKGPCCSQRRKEVVTVAVRAAVAPARLSLREKSRSSINGMSVKPPICPKIERRTNRA